MTAGDSPGTAISDRHTGGWGYLAALTPIIFGTTYLLTTEFLPPGRPLLAALMRSLPTGLVLIIGTRIPPKRWMARFFVLSVLYASGLFPLLFIAAYRLPGGVAAVINSLSPLLVVVISVPLLGTRDTCCPDHRGHRRCSGCRIAGAAIGRQAGSGWFDRHGRRSDHVQCGHGAHETLGAPGGNDLSRSHRLDLPVRRSHVAARHLDHRRAARPPHGTQCRRVDLSRGNQRDCGVRRLVLGSGATVGKCGHLFDAAQPRNRCPVGLVSARPAAQCLADSWRPAHSRFGRTRATGSLGPTPPTTACERRVERANTDRARASSEQQPSPLASRV